MNGFNLVHLVIIKPKNGEATTETNDDSVEILVADLIDSLTATSITAVSYTHLDVYKRQGVYLVTLLEFLTPKKLPWEKPGFFLFVIPKEENGFIMPSTEKTSYNDEANNSYGKWNCYIITRLIGFPLISTFSEKLIWCD